MQTYKASLQFSEEEMKTMEGKFFSSAKMRIFTNDVDVVRPDGKILCKFRKHRLGVKDMNALLEIQTAAKLGRTRPNASGIPPEGKYKYIVSKSSGKPLHVLTTTSRSGIVGFYDTTSNFGYHHSAVNTTANEASHTNAKAKAPRKHATMKPQQKPQPQCRMTAYTAKFLERYQDCLPVFSKVSRLFKSLVPKRYKAQALAVREISPEFVIPGTVFTTVTVNKNFRTALHKDSGDYEQGFGMMTVTSVGEYGGGYTLFPQYGFGIDCKAGDVLAMDVHQWHCNSEMTGTGTRVSYIFYVREKMQKSCPSLTT